MPAGETIDRIAAQYAVPAWSLEQANQWSENTPVAAGQQVVIPRHLLAPEPAHGDEPAAAPEEPTSRSTVADKRRK
jgi:LysM repeat protein